MTRRISAIIIFWCLIFSVTGALAVTSKDIIMLKKAGVSERLIMEIITSDAISRALISVDEVIEMKDAKIGDEVILTIIQQGNASVSELDKDDSVNRALKRKIKRQELVLEIKKKELDVLVEYVLKFINNPEIVKLVHEGKIVSEDYADIVKYLKQYARDEETTECGEHGDIIIDIKKTHE
jgi:hypothetical protein